MQEVEICETCEAENCADEDNKVSGITTRSNSATHLLKGECIMSKVKQDEETAVIETVAIQVKGQTKIGSHKEKEKDGTDITVNDYNYAIVNVAVPARNADVIEFYGLDRLCKLARAHEIVFLGNLTRSTLSDSNGKTQEEKNAIAQKVIGNDYPKCLDARIKTPGAKRISAGVKRAIEARATALTMMEGMLKKPFEKWSETSQNEFDATYPVPTAG